MKRLLFGLAFAVLATVLPLRAQTVLYNINHSQLSAYTDPSQFPSGSAQCQYMMNDGSMEHLHLEGAPGEPAYVVWDHHGQTFTYHLQVLAYNMAGTFAPSYAFVANWATNVIWDETGSSVVPTSTGVRGTGPSGIKTWGLTVTIDPDKWATDYSDGAVVSMPQHGWTTIRHQVRYFADDIGHVIGTSFYIPLYSNLDPTAPETDDGFNGHAAHFAQCDASSELGTTNTYIQQPLLILGPINAQWPTVTSSTYNYGGSVITGLGDGIFELRRDFDFHNGIPGELVYTQSASEQNGQVRSVQTNTIDLSKYAAGQQVKYGWIWRQPTTNTALASTVMEVWSMLVFKFTKGDGTVTPPPPPPPTQTWQSITLFGQELFDSITGALGKFRLCFGDTDHCFAQN